MYSIIPALVAVLFLAYGIYAFLAKGVTRVTVSFFAMCFAAFLWQGTWSFLFQLETSDWAMIAIKAGYFVILFLPTTLYHFLVEVNNRYRERDYVLISYGVATFLAGLLLASDLIVDGYREYFWGYYPSAGVLHPLHLAQTFIVVSRGLYITYVGMYEAVSVQRARLKLCLIALLVYFFAAVDYLVNYGLEMYPPGAGFLAISLGIISIAITRHGLLTSPMALAAAIVHEIRTPLASIGYQGITLERCLPVLIEGYKKAIAHNLQVPWLRRREIEALENIGGRIGYGVSRVNVTIDMILSAARVDSMDRKDFSFCSARECVREAFDTYPFEPNVESRVRMETDTDFVFLGAKPLLVHVLFNLMKNAVHAIKAAEKGNITVSLICQSDVNKLLVRDEGVGIPKASLPHIFEPYYSTKQAGAGAGIGLAFCYRVMELFGGRIICESVEGGLLHLS
ncbi:sensor histidine kinase [Alkalilimnicola ehrlichii]|uniref:histidine kinase n=1 Tax=Alkalilimnicola ehrlichii TaxID=351052 RepID=A0A3E0WVI8_9GAMM|nr:sensor histidine kinase [Alkalilimnicola ehrlichii]RFA36838.1 hypothetical protein CAL65_09965 [Alkalilimnicola ehrlichii]